MLVELSIRDLALLEAADLKLGGGLSVVTGETGAGKTLLVGSLELLLGLTPRGGAGALVRKGAREARVEGRFVIADAGVRARVRAFLERELPALADDLDADQEELELILGRSLATGGRTRAYVDQRPVPLRALRDLAPLLLEIHGQNEHQGLLDPTEQLRLVDGFAGAGRALERYVDAREAWRVLSQRARRLQAEDGERRDRLELLRFQRDELDEARVAPGEHAGLAGERDLLRVAEDLRRELASVLDEVFEGDPALRDRLRAAERLLERRREVLPAIAGVLEDVRSALVHLDEAGTGLASLADGVRDDPGRLEAVEERLAELERLEARHRTDEAGLLERREEIARTLTELEADAADLERIDEELDQARTAVLRAAKALGKKRRDAAPRLSEAVTRVLADLGLARARLEVVFTARGEDDERRFGPLGDEDLELHLAANPGEEPRALRHVASGGEAARIMLALRTVLSAADRGRTLVFDEIDAGVGGRLGPEVGAHLRRLGDHHQILCVTHLPAIAALAHLHLHVAKTVRKGRTRTHVATLEGDERVGEVADMIAGGADQETARAEARRLLAGADA